MLKLSQENMNTAPASITFCAIIQSFSQKTYPDTQDYQSEGSICQLIVMPYSTEVIDCMAGRQIS